MQALGSQWHPSRTPSSNNTSNTAKAARVARKFPPKVEAWLPGSKPLAASSVASMAPIGTPPPNPLASVQMSASIAVVLRRQKGAGPADARLHLVKDEEQRRARRRARGRPPGTPGCRDDAALALDRLEHHRGSGIRHRRLQRIQVVEGNVPKARGQGLKAGVILGLAGRRHRRQGPP